MNSTQECREEFDNKLLALIQRHFPSIPVAGKENDESWSRWLAFARDCATLRRAPETVEPTSHNELTDAEFIDRMIDFGIDHEPEGWPGVKMKDIYRLCNLARGYLSEPTSAGMSDEELVSKVPNLTPVIAWLENGCDTKEAISELKIYRSVIETLKRVATTPPPDTALSSEGGQNCEGYCDCKKPCFEIKPPVSAAPDTAVCKYGNETKSCTSSPMDCQCCLDSIATAVPAVDDGYADAHPRGFDDESPTPVATGGISRATLKTYDALIELINRQHKNLGEIDTEVLRDTIMRLGFHARKHAETSAQVERMRSIEDAARNLIKVKGRHHTEQAFKALEAALSATGQEGGGEHVASVLAKYAALKEE